LRASEEKKAKVLLRIMARYMYFLKAQPAHILSRMEEYYNSDTHHREWFELHVHRFIKKTIRRYCKPI